MLFYTVRCESVRKTVERVFGMLKKRFRVLKLPLMGNNVEEIEDILFSCFIMHNMSLKDKDRMDLGHMEVDWVDRPRPHTGPEGLFTTLSMTVHCCSTTALSQCRTRLTLRS